MTQLESSRAEIGTLVCLTSETKLEEEIIKAKEIDTGSSLHGAAEMNLTRIHEDVGWIPGLAQWVGDPALP